MGGLIVSVGATNDSTTNIASIFIGEWFCEGCIVLGLMHHSCSFVSLQREDAGGPVCKASRDGGCLSTQGSTLEKLSDKPVAFRRFELRFDDVDLVQSEVFVCDRENVVGFGVGVVCATELVGRWLLLDSQRAERRARG